MVSLSIRIASRLVGVKTAVVRCDAMDGAHSSERPADGVEPPQNKRQLSAAASKDKLIEATILCMATYGPAGVSIERITDAAGVSRGLVRHHFGNKRQLLLEAFRRLADEERAAFAVGPGDG